MPSGRDSFRRNRVAPSMHIIPLGAGTDWTLVGALTLVGVNSPQFTVEDKN
jgi:hypothetical protein